MNFPAHVVLSVVLLGACGAGGPSDAAVTRTDSAGVQLVTSHGPAWKAGSEWRVDSTPLVSIGDASVPDAVLFTEIGGARILGDGRIAVANGNDHALLFFTDRGARDGRGGREGSAPGEFRGISLVGMRGDSLLLWDPQLDRATMLGPDGGFGRAFKFGVGDSTAATRFGVVPIDLFTDGAVLLAGRVGAQSSGQGGVRRDPVPLLRGLIDGRIGRRLAVIPGTENVVVSGPGWVTSFERPFGHRTHSVAAGQGMLVSTGEFDGVMLLDSVGTLSAIWRLDRARRAVAVSDVEAVSARRIQQLNQLPPEYADAIHDVLQGVGFPTVLPPFDAVIRDETGATWLRNDVGPVLRDSIPRSWTVLDKSGRWLGEVVVPARVEIQQITKDRILGIWRDEYEVEHIRVYRLRR